MPTDKYPQYGAYQEAAIVGPDPDKSMFGPWLQGTTTGGIQEALNSGAAKVIVRGTGPFGSPTYLVSAKQNVGGPHTASIVMTDNQHLEIEPGAVIMQAPNTNVETLIANKFFGGGGTTTNVKLFCYGWLDGNFANQGADPGGAAFFSMGAAFYNTDHSDFYIKARNVGRYGALALQGSNNRVLHAWLESGTDTTNQSAALLLTGGAPESHNNTIDYCGALVQNALFCENGGYQYTIGRIFHAGPFIGLDLNGCHDVTVDAIETLGAQNALTITSGGAPVVPQLQRLSIGKIIAKGNSGAGVGIGQGVSISSIYRMYLNIGQVIVIDNGTVGNAAGVVINPFFSNIVIGQITSTDDQGTTTQNYGLDISNGCDSIVVLGGYNKNNRSIGVHFGGTNSNIRLKGMLGWNPQPVLATPFDNTNFTISPWGSAALPTSLANDYTVDGFDMLIVDTTPNGGTLTLKDSAATAIAAGYNSTSIPLRAPAGTKVRFVTALPTAIVVAGDN